MDTIKIDKLSAQILKAEQRIGEIDRKELPKYWDEPKIRRSLQAERKRLLAKLEKLHQALHLEQHGTALGSKWFRE